MEGYGILLACFLMYGFGYCMGRISKHNKVLPQHETPTVGNNECLKEFCECKHSTSKIEMSLTKCAECNKLVEN